MSKIKLVAIFVLCLIPKIAGAEFLGVKKCTESIVFPVNGPLDTLGRQTLAFSTADHPDSITVFTYLDDGTFIAWDSGGAAYACPGIDTTMRRGEVQIWFNRKIHWIDGIPSDSNSYTLSVAVWVWEDGYYRETNATVQVVTDSLNQLYTVRDSIQDWDGAGKLQPTLRAILDTLQVYDNAGQFQAEVAEILDTLKVYDSGTRSWGANILNVGGDAITDNGDGRLEVNVEEWRDVAPLALVTDGAVVSVVDSLSSAGGSGTMDAAEMEAINRDIIGDTFNVVGGFVLSDVKAYNGTTQSPTLAGYPDVNVFGWVDGTTPNALSAGNVQASISAMASGVVSASALHGAAAKKIADSVWNDWISSNTNDSTFGGAFTIGGAAVRANFDSSYGTIANTQVDDDVDVNTKTVTAGAIEDGDIATGGIDWGGELDTTGFGANAQEAAADAIVAQDVMLASDTTTIPDNVWGHGTRTLTSGFSAGDSALTQARLDSLLRLSRPDSVIYRLVREVWRNQDTAHVDTSKIGAWLMANVDRMNSTDTVARANSTDAGDSIRAHAPHDNNFGATTDNGNGAVTCTLDVRNASGGLANVTVTIKNTSNVELFRDVSNANGFVYFNLDQSTTYRMFAGGLAGSVHDSLPYQTLATTTAANKRDTIPMTTTAIGTPGAANLKRVYDYIYDVSGNPVEGADVIVEVIMPDSTIVPYDTSTSVSVGKKPNPVTAKTDAAGLFTIDLIPNDYIRPAGNRYRISVVYLGKIVYSVAIRANGTTTALVRSLQ